MFIQTIGWIGTFLIVFAYFLVSFKRIGAVDPRYQWMNLIGSAAVGVNVFHQQAWPAVGLEIIWAVIAVLALIKK